MPSDPQVALLFGYDPVIGEDARIHFVRQGPDCLQTLIQVQAPASMAPQGLNRLARICGEFPEEAAAHLLSILDRANDLAALDIAATCFRFLEYAPQQATAAAIVRMAKSKGLATTHYCLEALGYLGAADYTYDMVSIAKRVPSQLDYAFLHAMPRLTQKALDTRQARQVLESIESYVNETREFTELAERLTRNMDTTAFGRSAADPLLDRWLPHREPVYRLKALDALESLRLERTSAKIAERLFDDRESVDVRRRAAAVLGFTRGDGAIAAIERAFTGGALPKELRDAILQSFAQLYDRFPHPATRDLLDECTKGSSETAASIVYSLGLRAEGDEYLQAALQGSNEYVRGVAALALAAWKGEGARTKLEAALRGATGDLEQVFVLTALVRSGRSERIDELHKRLCAYDRRHGLRGLQHRWKRLIANTLALPGETSTDYADAWAEAMDISRPDRPQGTPKPVEVAHEKPVPERVAKRAVITLHGIRTRGGWQKEVDTPLARHDFVPYTRDYGFFYAWQLALHFMRQRRVEWFHRKYEEVRKETDGLPSIIAHSFGTYLVAQTLLKYQEVKFDRIVLCGSIIRRDYPWTDILDRGGAKRVLNDYGGKDFWVKAAEWFVSDGGPSGALGFEDNAQGRVVHRFRPEFRHSDYFYESNYEDTWIVFLNGNDPDETRPLPTRAPNWKHRIFLAFVLLALLLAVFSGYRWYKRKEAAANNHWTRVDPLRPPAYASSLDRVWAGGEEPLSAPQAEHLQGLRHEAVPTPWVAFGSPEYAGTQTPAAIGPASPISAQLVLFAFAQDGAAWRQIEKSELKSAVRCDRCRDHPGMVRLVVFVFPLDGTAARFINEPTTDPAQILSIREDR